MLFKCLFQWQCKKKLGRKTFWLLSVLIHILLMVKILRSELRCKGAFIHFFHHGILYQRWSDTVSKRVLIGTNATVWIVLTTSWTHEWSSFFQWNAMFIHNQFLPCCYKREGLCTPSFLFFQLLFKAYSSFYGSLI